MSYAYELADGTVATANNLKGVQDNPYIEVTEIPDAPRESWRIVDGVLTHDAVVADAIEAKTIKDALKLSGIEFEGVMCSAMAEDMWGLNSIQGFIAAGNSTPFVFENGNTLVITPTNLAAFTAVWMTFRASFFV